LFQGVVTQILIGHQHLCSTRLTDPLKHALHPRSSMLKEAVFNALGLGKAKPV
jgi:hypothetical protein